jgi:hypothetical protein
MIRRHAAALALAALPLCAPPAQAAEHRLLVANILDGAFRSYMRAGEAGDGATGRGLERLEASLDSRDFPGSVLLYDRHLQAAPAASARAYGGAPVKAELKPGGTKESVWDEARWEGTAGEQSVWLIATDRRRPGEIARVALRGTGPIRHYTPYGVSGRGPRLPVARFPLNFLFAHEDDADFWSRRVAPALDLGQGVAVIVVANESAIAADQAWIIVTHAATPTTYKVVVGWRERTSEHEAPDGFFRINRLR